MNNARNKAVIIAVMGASGSGKSAFIKQTIRKELPRRLMIFDPMKEYGDFGEVVTTAGALLAKAKGDTFAICFQPVSDPDMMKRQFDYFCTLAHAVGNLTMICEELSFVTSPSKAPPGWSAVTLTGRHRKLRVYGSSQRPASIDKNFFSNATKVRTGRLNYAADIKTLANVLGVDVKQIQDLLPLEYLERDMGSGKVTAGKLVIR